MVNRGLQSKLECGTSECQRESRLSVGLWSISSSQPTVPDELCSEELRAKHTENLQEENRVGTHGHREGGSKREKSEAIYLLTSRQQCMPTKAWRVSQVRVRAAAMLRWMQLISRECRASGRSSTSSARQMLTREARLERKGRPAAIEAKVEIDDIHKLAEK